MRRTPVMVTMTAAVGLTLLLLPVLGLIARAPWSRLPELASTRALEASRLSLVVATSAAAVDLVLGIPLAWLLAKVEFRGKPLVRALVVLPLVMPPVVGGVALLAAIGRRGLLGSFLPFGLPFTTAGAVVAAAFVSFPLLVLVVEAGFRSVDERLEDAAAVMGGDPGYVLRRVSLPLVLPQVAAGTVLAWGRALGEFGATIMFAGNLQGVTQTLPLAVYETQQTDPAGAILLSLLLVALSLGMLALLRGRAPA